MTASEFDKARAARRMLDIKMPGTRASVFPWLEVVTNREPRFFPVIRRVLFGEGDYVQQGEPIMELEQNEYFTSSLGHLLAPESGIIRKIHIKEREPWAIEKHKYVGEAQHCPNYEEILITMELEHPHNLSEKEVSRRLINELVANGAKARRRNMISAVAALLFAPIIALIVISILVGNLTGWWIILLVPLILLIVGLTVVSMWYSVLKYLKNKAFNPASAFGVRG